MHVQGMVKTQYRWGVKKFPNVFNGRDCADTLIGLESLNDGEEAERLAQELQGVNAFVVHSRKNKPFESKPKAYYRFEERFFNEVENKRKLHKPARNQWAKRQRIEAQTNDQDTVRWNQWAKRQRIEAQ